MADPDRSPAAGGCLIALAVLVGVAAGAVAHQPTVGFLAGLAVGVAAAVAIWLIDRK